MKKPNCPKCGQPMILRTAKKGPFAGSKFWGCSEWPRCDGTRNFEEDDPINYSIKDEKEDIQLESFDINEISELYEPVEVNINYSGLKGDVQLFQAVSLPRQYIEFLYYQSAAERKNQINSFSQWQLISPANKKIGLKEKQNTVISTLEKMLLRGRLTPCTPLLEAWFTEQHHADELNEFFENCLGDGGLIKQALPFFSKYRPRAFDSFSEYSFYDELASCSDIEHWVNTQIPLSSLISDVTNPLLNQRVDFLIAHPLFQPLVVEIDGPQHLQTQVADKERDRLLINAGYKVVRIPAEKTKDLNLAEYPELTKLLLDIQEFHKDKEFWISDITNVFLLRSASQLQIALLQALKLGWLPFEEYSNWKISVRLPRWAENIKASKIVFKKSIEDFINLLCNLYEFQNNMSIDVTFDLSFSEEDEAGNIHFEFCDVTEANSSELIRFLISDTFLPFDIGKQILPTNPITIENPSESLALYFFRYIFGKSEFKAKQWDAIARLVGGKDTILLLPTGHGKSMVFQLVSFLLPGICIVIDPLISLINDQIENLKKHGIDKVVGITSELNLDERVSAIHSFSKGNYSICYVAPERFQIKEFRLAVASVVQNTPVNLIVIDEAHCVSEWGHDFRISYLNIAKNSRTYTEKDGFIPPLAALTGTASRSVLRDMRRELAINELEAVISLENFDRPELNFKVIRCATNEKRQVLLKILSDLENKFIDNRPMFQLHGPATHCGLIFTPHVNGSLGVVEYFNFLKKTPYGGFMGIYSGKAPRTLTDKWQERKRFEARQFKLNRRNLLVCTSAFGMGIDKENIHYTIHINIPKSIEAAYQEAGRAGRDRHKSYCYFIVSPDDIPRINALLNPLTTLEEMNDIMSKVRYNDDDITRQVYFHINSFKGSEKEIEVVKGMLKSLDNLEEGRDMDFPFSEENRVSLEKAIHRLLIIGVLQDYEIDYAHQVAKVILSGFKVLVYDTSWTVK